MNDKPTNRVTIPDALRGVAAIDGPTAAALCGMGVSKWLAHVAEGDAPKPFVRRLRFTRWLVSDVIAWFEKLPETLPEDPKVLERAKKGRDAAKAKRAASSSERTNISPAS